VHIIQHSYLTDCNRDYKDKKSYTVLTVPRYTAFQQASWPPNLREHLHREYMPAYLARAPPSGVHDLSASIMAAYPARTPPSGVCGRLPCENTSIWSMWPPTLREHLHLEYTTSQQTSWPPTLREHPHLTPPSGVHDLQQNPMAACFMKGTLLESKPPSTNLMTEYQAPPTLGGPHGNFSP